ncbi:MAG TPA: phospholipase D-like domain-containing protein [Candidatus Dormibacteraeota bacterium]|nr:phospholipase D-like domain-containing protein [Candidatus Dormibacteraeota bacterium]
MFKLPFGAPRSFESKLYSEVSFYTAFIADIKQASSTIIIESPFITYRRGAYLLPEFVRALDRGVSIMINTRDPLEHEGSMRQQAQAVLHTFEGMGVDVQFTTKLHRKLAIIDKSVLWEGSLNILSHANSREVMRRTLSRTHSKAMMKFLSVKR